jgi:nitrite reductase/ring-hydroxylating ferredoxin subunit
MDWVDLIGLAELQAKGKVVARQGGRQILLIATPGGVHACVNRCPHQGYPLSEGVLSDGGCVLTCNWHNWKFDLKDGRTLVGGDRLRRFPVRIDAGRVLVDLSPENPVARRQRVLAGVARALEDQDQERLVRECARLASLPGGMIGAVTTAVAWAASRLEFGTTHAFAGAPDWLALHDAAGIDADERLAAIGEVLGHIADDAAGGGVFPFPPGEAPWDEAAFLAAVEAEDEARAAVLIRGALSGGLAATDLAPALFTAALSHYADFGHSLIYCVKTLALIRRLGRAAAEPLTLLLVRSLIFARREDLLPEFRDYRLRLDEWGQPGRAQPLESPALRRKSAKSAMALVGAWSARHAPEEIFSVLVEAAAWTLLHVDEAALIRTRGKIADNVGWLDFTHAVTFADAGLQAARARPQLWPAVLLQLACFIGRNSAYLDPDADIRRYWATDHDAFLETATHRLFDHAQEGFIVSVHFIKTLMAAKALAAEMPDRAAILYAAANRFLQAPMKRRHVLRTARQMRAFVAQE